MGSRVHWGAAPSRRGCSVIP